MADSERAELGVNRTGTAIHQKSSKATIDFAEEREPSSRGGLKEESSVLTEYAEQAEPAASIPPPPSMKGLASTAMQKMKGKRPEGFIDKLGERLAFERGGVRLYDALIAKCRAARSNDGKPGVVDLGKLIEMRNEELEHFKMMAECIEQIGGDPTAVTPSADVVGVEASGLMQVVNEPRIPVSQSLSAILTAELADHDGWTALIDLAEKMGMDEMRKRFKHALEQEDDHLATVRGWCKQLAMQEAGLS